jgi:hypothetical protein
MGSGLKLDISRFRKKHPYFVAYYLMGQGSMEGLAGEVIKLYMIKYQVSSLTPSNTEVFISTYQFIF